MCRRRAERRRLAGRPPSSRAWLVSLAVASLGLPPVADAADGLNGASGQRQSAFEPSVSFSETLTDNYDVSSQKAEADAITRLTAGLRWSGNAGAVRGYLDYALTSLVYARHSARNELQNALNANATVDLIDQRLQVVTSAAIAKTAISAFGAQPGLGGDGNSNATETRTFDLIPTWRGPLGPDLRYGASLAYALSSAAGSGLGNSTNVSAMFHLEPVNRATLGWTLDASHVDTSFKQGRSTMGDRVYGGLSFDLNALDLRLNASAGVENTNIASLDPVQSNTWSMGLLWTPSPVTQVIAQMEERFFGRSHLLSLEHRTARTIFRLRSSRSLSTSGSQVAGVRGTAYDLFFSQLASQQPDPLLREDLVNRLLRAQGIDPSTVINTGFLRSAATVQELLEFSAAWSSQRDVLVILVNRGKTRRADSLSSAMDDLSRAGAVSTSNLSLNLSHRLTPTSSLGVLVSVQRASGSQADLSSQQAQAELQFSSRLTADSTVGASLRRARYHTGLQATNETALSASYAVRF